MANKQKTPTTAGKSFAQAAQEAKDRPTILPKLTFGADKLAVVSYEVEFLEPEPREIEFEDKLADEEGIMAKGYAINLRVVRTVKAPEGDDAWGAQGEDRSLVFRDDPNNSLTNGIMNAFKKNGNTLLGLRVKLGTRVYRHEKWGPSRAYDVLPVSREDDDSETL